ncbi:MAG TPA: DUF3856 domain-containing protein [Blastocatellia bacterium]|nr:DUF3856 domain-containing protein [Blastocatellia bacterium]
MDRIGTPENVHILIPGLAEIDSQVAPKTFVAFLSGRLSDDAARIKQGHLSIAAFAKAQREARENNMPDALRDEPKLLLRGVDFDGRLAGSSLRDQQGTENELKKFAQDYANGVINLHALTYTQDRQQLYSELSKASVALMPSWHEGFGLVAWEAIAAGVPLIVSIKSGVYRLLKEEFFGAEIGYVYPLDIRGALDFPYFNDDDLKATVATLKTVAHDYSNARKKASRLRSLLGKYTWAACAEQAAKAFSWELKKGILPDITPESLPQTSTDIASPPATTAAVEKKLLQMPAGQWRAGAGMADSQLLRAEEALLEFDKARQPEVDSVNVWLDDPQWPLSVRLITGAGGQGKTRLSLEICQQRLESDWYAGFLDSSLEANRMDALWESLRKLNQSLLIVVDYAETRQTAFLTLLRAALQKPAEQPVRMLLLARDGGEWWDNLPSRDPQCEALLSGYATSGPFKLQPLYAAEHDRQVAYRKAIEAFAQALGGSAPDTVPDLLGEHFERPLYVQMAALLALYGEQPTTAQGLTKALLNHERRYWQGVLAHLNWPEPERRAEQLLALTILAGGFAIPRDAEQFWVKAKGKVISPTEFNSMYRDLVTLYPGKQGLQPLRPDLLGEALVAQALLRSQGDTLLDAVLSKDASQSIRRNALTVIARLSNHRSDLQETLVDALSRHFRHCYKDMVAVSTETISRLPTLAELAFARLSPSNKSQVAGLLDQLLEEESIQLAELSCLVSEYLAEKAREGFEKKPGNTDRIVLYAQALGDYALNLARSGRYQRACDVGLNSLELYRQLPIKDLKRFEPSYATYLSNYSSHLGEVGQYEEALNRALEGLEIRKRLAQKNPARFEPDYAWSLSNYSSHLNYAGRYDEALDCALEGLEIRKRLAQKNSARFEPDYAWSLGTYAIHLSYAGRYDEALEHSHKALEINERLAQKNPDRFEPDYAMSLGNYASRLSEAGRYEEAFEHSRKALEIDKQLTQKNPDRFEPDYARSLGNYASNLSDAGRYEEALEHAHEALEIRRRLAEKNPDRFEPDYAASLGNDAIRLSEVGRYEEALEHSRGALEIHKRLAQKNPDRFAEALFSDICVAHLLAWLCDQDAGSDKPDLNQLTMSIPSHRRPLLLLYSVFIESCSAADQTIRINAFRQVFSYWADLSVINKIEAETNWLCAAAWCAKFEPAEVIESDWEISWRQFVKQRNGSVPQWMLEVARRLEFQWPE